MILNTAMRPLEHFNPDNAGHRQHYANFLVNNTWGTCPIRFTVDGSDNVAHAMQRLLTEYYINKEFFPPIDTSQIA